MGKLINRIPGSCILISRLPGLASGTHAESLGKPSDSTSVLEALPDKLDIQKHSPSILYTLIIDIRALKCSTSSCKIFLCHALIFTFSKQVFNESLDFCNHS